MGSHSSLNYAKPWTSIFAIALFWVCITGANVDRKTAWQPQDLPSPLSDPGNLCRRGGRRSYVCNPDGVLSERLANLVDDIIEDLAGIRNAILPTGFDGCHGDEIARPLLQCAVLETIPGNFRGGTDPLKSFANSLHSSWELGSGHCSASLVLVITTEKRSAHVTAGNRMSAARQSRIWSQIANQLLVVAATTAGGPVMRMDSSYGHRNTSLPSTEEYERQSSKIDRFLDLALQYMTRIDDFLTVYATETFLQFQLRIMSYLIAYFYPFFIARFYFAGLWRVATHGVMFLVPLVMVLSLFQLYGRFSQRGR